MPSENAHAARVEDGIVRDVIVIPYCNDDDAEITSYCNGIGLPGTWIDTAYTGSRRGKYAAMGDLYDEETNEFVCPIPPEPDPVEPPAEAV